MKKIFIIILILSVSMIVIAQQVDPNKPIRQGFPFSAKQGMLFYDVSDDICFFAFDEDFDGLTASIPAGKKIEVLGCATLEKMTTALIDHNAADFKIWGTFSTYKDKNYIYPVYFIPLTKIEDIIDEPIEDVNDPNDPNQISQAEDIDDPDIIPEDIMERLKPKRIITTEQITQTLDARKDAVLVNRTGYITKASKDSYMLRLDNLGRKVQKTSFKILPSAQLERALGFVKKDSGKVRFKFANIITKYKDQNYILLQKAVPSYSHRNFAR